MEPEEKVSILVVDDNEAKLRALEAALSDLDQNLVLARSGQEALRALLKEDFAVILLDVRMPVLDGFETAALIRQREKSAHIPILFVTAADERLAEAAHGYSLGAVDYIYAPVVPEVLRAKVAAFVRLKRQEERIRRLEQQVHERELAAVRESLETETRRNRFFTLSIDMLAIAGFDGFFKQLNPSWEKTLGFAQEELLGRPFLEFVHPEDRDATQAEMAKLSSGAAVIGFENRYRAKDGSWRWLLWNSAPELEAELIYAVAHDITERKLAEQARVEREALLTALNNELEAFSYSVSHDLRAPLRHVQGYVDLLVRDAGDLLPDKSRRYLKTIAEAAGEMGQLIDDLLAFSRMARAEMRQSSLNLEELARECLCGLDTDGRTIEWRIGEMPLVKGDPAMVKQVLANLLGNAVKYTRPRDPAHIEIGCGGRESGRVIVFVRDNGVGFDMKYADKLFGVFQRLHHAREFEGTGIGLANVRRVITRHGGRVWAEAAVNQGATFYFTLEMSPQGHSVDEERPTC